MSKPLVLITGLFMVIFCATAVSIGLADANRRIPWDCSDWTAYVHNDRTTAILETLAENRGKALYCGIDQSDTFTKAETWEAGKDRNERDDTVYFGENGNFRGFIAAQEGWLTEGESGITGQSTATIFEFPRPQRRVIRTKRLKLPESPDYEARDWDIERTVNAGAVINAQRVLRVRYQINVLGNNATRANAADFWNQRVATAARAECRRRGYDRVTGIERGDLPAAVVQSSSTDQIAEGFGYVNIRQVASGPPAEFRGTAYQWVRWSATCVKKVRRTRR